MPNWCYTDITIKCKSEKKAADLYNNIVDWTSHEYCKSDFGKDWLGNVVGNSKIDVMEDGEDFSIKCRGDIAFKELLHDEIHIQTETAWVPMLKMWEMICNKFLGVGEWMLFYLAEEPGCGIYDTNYPEFEGTYHLFMQDVPETKELYSLLDTYSNNELADKDVIPALQKYLKTSGKDPDKLIAMLNKSPAGEYIELRRCKYAGIDNWD